MLPFSVVALSANIADIFPTSTIFSHCHLVADVFARIFRVTEATMILGAFDEPDEP